ncbi:MAG TPA: SMP-30/gluconolactonase/LRE family protein [Acidimicrobiales bacterium]|nr:SMP-30/gluconolactonase/LRE family protein [Acidimicrobiales bacterium]
MPDPEVLATGYRLVEGPRADGEGGVYFSDALGGGVYRWSTDGVDTVVPKRRGVGGLALHAHGGVVVSGRDITHVAPDGTNRLLFAAPEGVTGFNDIAATADGSILAGGLRFLPFTGEKPVPGAFWHITAPEVALVALEDVEWPNGVGDDGEGAWCICDYSRGRVTVIRGQDRNVVQTPSGEADGLAFDDEGAMWVAQPQAGSLVRMTLDGRVDRTLELLGFQPASLAFDDDTLYVTTIASETRSGELLRVPAPIPGRRHHHATI